MGFPSPVLTSRDICPQSTVAQLSNSSRQHKDFCDKTDQPSGQSGCSSLIFDGELSGFSSPFSSSMGFLHDLFFCLWRLPFVLELQGSCCCLRKDIIICKWCSVARAPDCIRICSEDVHGREPATHGVLAFLCSVYSCFSAIVFCFNSLSDDSASPYVLFLYRRWNTILD